MHLHHVVLSDIISTYFTLIALSFLFLCSLHNNWIKIALSLPLQKHSTYCIKTYTYINFLLHKVKMSEPRELKICILLRLNLLIGFLRIIISSFLVSLTPCASSFFFLFIQVLLYNKKSWLRFQKSRLCGRIRFILHTNQMQSTPQNSLEFFLSTCAFYILLLSSIFLSYSLFLLLFQYCNFCLLKR